MLSDPALVGRAWERRYLLRRLRHHGEVVLTGPPGVGKSALCEAVAQSWKGHVELLRPEGGCIELRQGRGHLPTLLIDDTGGKQGQSSAQRSQGDCTLRTIRASAPLQVSTPRREFYLRELFLDDAIDLVACTAGNYSTADHYIMEMVRNDIPLSPLFVNAGLALGSSRRALGDLLPLFAYARADVLRDVLRAVEAAGGAATTFTGEALLGPDGRALKGAEAKPLLIQVHELTDEVLRIVRDDPAQMHSLTPRQFEALVAELLRRQGFAVELTARSRDGGRDIHAARHDRLGSFLYLVECKRYAPDWPVGVDVVRQLFGVVHQAGATAGIVATTSRFTRAARDFERSVKNQMSLRDFTMLRSWLAEPDPLVFKNRPSSVSRKLMAPLAGPRGTDLRGFMRGEVQVKKRPRTLGTAPSEIRVPGGFGWPSSWN